MNTIHTSTSTLTCADFGWINPVAPENAVAITIPRSEYVYYFPGYDIKVLLACGNEGNYIVATREMALQHSEGLRSRGFANATLHGGITESGRLVFLPIFESRGIYKQEDIDNINLLDMVHWSHDDHWVQLPPSEECFIFTKRPVDQYPEPEAPLALNAMLALALQGSTVVTGIDHPIFLETQAE